MHVHWKLVQRWLMLSGALLIRIYHTHYYSKWNGAQKVAFIKQQFVLRVFVLTSVYCTCTTCM